MGDDSDYGSLFGDDDQASICTDDVDRIDRGLDEDSSHGPESRILKAEAKLHPAGCASDLDPLPLPSSPAFSNSTTYELPTLPLPAGQNVNQAANELAQLCLPTTPDPLITPLCDELGHTSGDHVVSTQTFNLTADASPSEVPSTDDELEAALWREMLGEQPGDAQAGLEPSIGGSEASPSPSTETPASLNFAAGTTERPQGITGRRREEGPPPWISFNETEVLRLLPWFNLSKSPSVFLQMPHQS